MHDFKGAHLFVNLGASQTRRRLKGFGHGVRQVQTAGIGRAVIIHTATGQHLSELEARFADVGYSETELGLCGRIDSVPMTDEVNVTLQEFDSQDRVS
jgi:DNA transformation protein and related proteins